MNDRMSQEREDHILDCYETIKQRDAVIERLRAALELYGCPGLGKCPEPRMKDGTCLRANTGGLCGDDARRALEEKT